MNSVLVSQHAANGKGPYAEPGSSTESLKLPRHWMVKPLKYVARINSDALPEATDPNFELEYVDIGNVDSVGRITDAQLLTFKEAPSRARRIVTSGDTIISTVRTYLKAIAFLEDPPKNLVVSTGFAVLRPHATVLPKYLWYMAQCSDFIHRVVAHSDGVSYPAIPPTRLATLKVWVPPIAEQERIICFLEREAARIDTITQGKERLIALLEEKNATLINRWVTRGLDESIPMKESGVTWLAAIPTHWDVVPVKRALARSDYGISDSTGADGAYVVLTMGNIQDGEIVLSAVGYVNDAPADLILERDDLLFNRTNSLELVGKVGIFRGKAADKITFASYLVRLRTNSTTSPEFLNYLLNSPLYQACIQSMALLSINQANVNPSKLGAMKIALPPLAEQRTIAEALHTASARIETIKRKSRQQISKLQEYRSALIAAAVTGQIEMNKEWC